MASNEMAIPVDFLLSQDELVYILSLLSVTTLPGLEDDPAGEMTPEQQAVAHRVASRGLRARLLASLREDGEVVLQNNLLAAVGTCAFSQHAIFVNHWAINQTLPTPFFAHIRENNTVVHTRPADVLHFFALLPAATDLLQQILSFCEYTDAPASNPYTLKLPSALLTQVREKAEMGAKADAVNLMTATGNVAESAQAFGDTLATQYRASSVQLAKQKNGQTEQQDILLLQDNQYRWLISSPEADTVTIQSVTGANIQELLAKWLAP